MNKYLNLVGWFGGKFPHLPWLLSRFPKGDYHFVDGTCGAGTVSLNVDYPLKTVNDVNQDIINLFKVLREQQEELIRAIYFTPFSRKEVYDIIDDPNPVDDPVEKARRFFLRCVAGYGANGSQNDHRGLGFEFKTVRRGFYRVDSWNSKLKKLPIIAEKLRAMQIESMDVLDLIPHYDRETCFIYIDPPYLGHTRYSKKRYRHEADDAEFHIKLAEKLTSLKHAIWAISGYQSDLYDDLYRSYNKDKSKGNRSNTANKLTQEVLWFNYELQGEPLKIFN